MSKVSQVINGGVHDINNAIGTMKTVLYNAKNSEDEIEYLSKRKGLIEERLQKIIMSVDSLYTEFRKSKLWEEHL